MPTTRKRRALQEAEREASPSSPNLGVRRSKRIRKQNVDEAPNPSTTTRSVPKRPAKQGAKRVATAALKRSSLPQISSAAASKAVQAAEKIISGLSDHDDSASDSSVVPPTTPETSDRSSTNGLHRLVDGMVTRESVQNVEFSEETWTVHFKDFWAEKYMKIPFEETEGLQICVREFLEKAEEAIPDEDSYDAIEQLRQGINNWTKTVRLAAIADHEFNDVFQKDIMMSIVKKYDKKSPFDFLSQGQWLLQGSQPLPSTDDPEGLITGPKPDLAIFFKADHLLGINYYKYAIPAELKSFMCPDNNAQRGFPFLFVEANVGNDIEHDALTNMHSACQALCNIFELFRKVGHEAAFEQEVRLFSITMNDRQIIARVHRAVPIIKPGGQVELKFYYDELNRHSESNYTKDKAYTLFQNILTDYAKPILLIVLRTAIAKVMKQHVKNLEPEDDDEVPDRSPERAVSVQAGPEDMGGEQVDPKSQPVANDC